MTIRRVRIARWITKATDTYSEYVILILHGSSVYANAPDCYVYTYIACLVMYVFTEKRRRALKADCLTAVQALLFNWLLFGLLARATHVYILEPFLWKHCYDFSHF